MHSAHRTGPKVRAVNGEADRRGVEVDPRTDDAPLQPARPLAVVAWAAERDVRPGFVYAYRCIYRYR